MPRDTDPSAYLETKGLADNDKTRACGSGDLVLEHDFHGRGVRTVLRDGQPWFVAADVCAALDHSDPSKAVARLEADEKGASIVPTLGGPQEMGVINESGLYALILTSRKPQAKAFRRWVTGEVLPSLRRTAAGEVATDLPGHVTLSLEAPGRYTVTLTRGQPAHIQRMPLHSVTRDVKTSDIEILALALRTTRSWWRRVQHLASVGIGASDSFSRDQFELAVLIGDQLGDQYLRMLRTAEV